MLPMPTALAGAEMLLSQRCLQEVLATRSRIPPQRHSKIEALVEGIPGERHRVLEEVEALADMTADAVTRHSMRQDDAGPQAASRDHQHQLAVKPVSDGHLAIRPWDHPYHVCPGSRQTSGDHIQLVGQRPHHEHQAEKGSEQMWQELRAATRRHLATTALERLHRK
mmetsp:Transcript_62705/g.158357  ORF Transcript_62705/g.158357 Transcript_62705/m.158357 type:complete len:167 (-) Transcript_62705:1831-2331(-)